MGRFVIKPVGKRHFTTSCARVLPPERLLPGLFKFVKPGGDHRRSVQPIYFQPLRAGYFADAGKNDTIHSLFKLRPFSSRDFDDKPAVRFRKKDEIIPAYIFA
jgi:hypothetical protein